MLKTNCWLNRVKAQTIALLVPIAASVTLIPLMEAPAQANSIQVSDIRVISPRRVRVQPQYNSPPVYNSPNDINSHYDHNRSQYDYNRRRYNVSPGYGSYPYGYPSYGYPRYRYPGGINIRVRKVPSGRTGINNSTLINPTIIDSQIRNSTIVNPVIVNPDRGLYSQPGNVYVDSYGRTYSHPQDVYIYPNSY